MEVCRRRAERWLDAARCHARAGEPFPAGRAYARAGDQKFSEVVGNVWKGGEVQ